MVLTAFGQSTNAGAAALVQLPDGTFVAGGSAGSSFALARYWGDNSPPNYALGSPNTIFVALTYRQVLGREVDQGGLTGWVNWMAQGASSARVVQGIEQSTEYRTRVVDNLYATLLGRPADPGGEAGFVNALAAGMTIEQVKAGILGSPEYFQHHGGSNALFLESLYHDLLNRPTDPGGAASWTAAMQAGMDHTAVALAIARSPEALTDLVQSTYQAELHRSADPSGLAAWLQAVENGMRDEAFLAGVAGSDEFFQGM